MASVFRRGIALGEADARNDAIIWRFGEKLYTCWTRDCAFEARYNGYFYEMDVKKLRRLVRTRKATRIKDGHHP